MRLSMQAHYVSLGTTDGLETSYVSLETRRPWDEHFPAEPLTPSPDGFHYPRRVHADAGRALGSLILHLSSHTLHICMRRQSGLGKPVRPTHVEGPAREPQIPVPLLVFFFSIFL